MFSSTGDTTCGRVRAAALLKNFTIKDFMFSSISPPFDNTYTRLPYRHAAQQHRPVTEK